MDRFSWVSLGVHLGIFFNDYGMRSRIELMIPIMELGYTVDMEENEDA